jgi:hypothetical protein
MSLEMSATIPMRSLKETFSLAFMGPPQKTLLGDAGTNDHSYMQPTVTKHTTSVCLKPIHCTAPAPNGWISVGRSTGCSATSGNASNLRLPLNAGPKKSGAALSAAPPQGFSFTFRVE